MVQIWSLFQMWHNLYLSSNISQLMNYVGFATWFSIGAAVSWSTSFLWSTKIDQDLPLSLLITNYFWEIQIDKNSENAHQVLCVPWLRWKCPDLERPIRVGASLLKFSLNPLILTVHCIFLEMFSTSCMPISEPEYQHYKVHHDDHRYP